MGGGGAGGAGGGGHCLPHCIHHHHCSSLGELTLTPFFPFIVTLGIGISVGLAETRRARGDKCGGASGG